MAMSNRQIASQILDYWSTIEFLGQDTYETCTGEKRLRQELRKFKRTPKKRDRKKQITVFEKLDADSDIYKKIYDQAKSCSMSTWGNLTFYVGKIKRQKCIKRIADVLGVTLEQAEKNQDDIPMLSFQCNNRGKFIEHSLSLSTIVWALSQVKSENNKQISDILSEKKYYQSLERLEKKYFDSFSDNILRESSGEESGVQGSEDEIPIFEPDAITVKRIFEICRDFSDVCEKIIGEPLEESVGLKFQLFKNTDVKEKNEDDDYMGLSHDFFSSDLKMVKSYLDEKKSDRDSVILNDLVSYICAPYDGSEHRARHDLISPDDEEIFEGELLEILNISNAPVAKWPSEYMPVLMQQVAINLSLSKESGGILDENGKIFSVNGPPGTGKTTLLKEIIAENIVEKAVLLSKYDSPDDAFVGINFEKGEYNGAYVPPKNGNKNSFYKKWFKFKDEHIADYGILVASSNNAAVENISRELPMDSSIRGIFEKETGDEGRDIFFTNYANELFGSGDSDGNAWGLVAVPLGKKSNISKFYTKVLDKILSRDMLKNDTLREQLSNYGKKRKEFIDQLNRVRFLQADLSAYCDVTIKAHNASLQLAQMEKRNTSELDENKCLLESINCELKSLEGRVEADAIDLRRTEALCKEIDQVVNEYRNKLTELSDQELKFRKEGVDAEKSASIVKKIFKKKQYEDALKFAESCRDHAERCVRKASELAGKVNEAEEKQRAARKEQEGASERLFVTKKQQRSIQQKKEQIENEIIQLTKEIDNARIADVAAKKEMSRKLDEFKHRDEFRSGCVLDSDFIKQILSDDIKTSTEAQTKNPWISEEYNREREKLFFLALQMTECFLLSSKHCRTNLQILGQYWGLRTESGVDKIIFDLKDKERMAASLFNTLFLLTPVISSTFASVGRLLEDVKEPGALGTLIIDEAGQAQPHMAVGALFRSRRSIIVGDPHQVEPVVTDDLKLLKGAFSGPIYANYKNKALSVQNCADIINSYGTFFENGMDHPEWVGCPLIVHRRCISPMYEISNRISYYGIMKQKTQMPSEDKEKTFVYPKSQWINTGGSENGSGDHFVREQGTVVCNIVNEAFEKAEKPDLYIISPFTSVVSGVCKSLKDFSDNNAESPIGKSRYFDEWKKNNIGTVHKFQGKEANEVIFVLGCDETVQNRYAVKGFVNSNIVNVAVTRAKYRIYFVGNSRVWANNQFVNEAKAIIDTLPLQKISEAEELKDPEEKVVVLSNQASQLPGATSFVLDLGKNENGESEYDIESDEFISSIDKASFLEKNFSEDQYKQFGFESQSEFEQLPEEIKKNLRLGMKLYYLLRPVYSLSPDLDASCCGILFCKGMELYLRENFVDGLKARFPDYNMKNAPGNRNALCQAKDKDFMIGTVQHILKSKVSELGEYMTEHGEPELGVAWWKSFSEKLRSFARKRNQCCHPQWFKWQDMRQLIEYEFIQDGPDVAREPKIGGVFQESRNGKKLLS